MREESSPPAACFSCVKLHLAASRIVATRWHDANKYRCPHSPAEPIPRATPALRNDTPVEMVLLQTHKCSPTTCHSERCLCARNLLPLPPALSRVTVPPAPSLTV